MSKRQGKESRACCGGGSTRTALHTHRGPSHNTVDFHNTKLQPTRALMQGPVTKQCFTPTKKGLGLRLGIGSELGVGGGQVGERIRVCVRIEV
jgi:hypothetical protein